MRRAKTSRWVSALSILGLILVSVLMVLVLDASSLVNPTIPLGSGSPNNKQGPTGALVVDLFSNTNETSRLSLPTNSQYPIGEWPVTVTQVTNSSTPTTYALITDTKGGAYQQVSPGKYTVSFTVESITIKVPVTVQLQNVTRAIITVTGADFPIVYSEESTGVLTPGGIQSSMYVEVAASSPIVNASEPVVIKSQEAVAGQGRIADATVITQEPASHGTEWLQLVTQQPFSPVNATSIYLTTWTYSAYVTMTPIGLNGVSADL